MSDNKTGKARTKSEVYHSLGTAAGLTRKQVAAVFDELGKLIKQDLGKKGPGLFTIPGLLKLRRTTRPATKARKGINPFTKEEIMIKAKPARTAVKARPLKGLNDMVK
jgi:nucleoid DNA-binding protein